MLAHQEPSHGHEPPPVVLDSDNQRIRKRRKDDLFQFESTTTPRPADVCDRFAARVTPAWGFAVYGVLYFFVAFTMFALCLLPGYLLGAAVGAKGALWVDVLGWTLGLAGFALAWWGFARWVKRKRRAALPLVRDGVLVDGSVVDKWAGPVTQIAKRVAFDAAVGRAGVKFYRVQFEHAGMSRMIHVPVTGSVRPAPGTTLRVLFHADSKHALVFDLDGRAQVAGVRG